MAVAGCTGVFVGLESLNEENINDSRKKSPAPQDYARRVAVLHRFGIQVNGRFVFGFDHDRPDVFQRTVDWIEANRLECSTFHLLTPYPATPLFRQLESEGRLLHRDWDKFECRAALSCDELSVQAFEPLLAPVDQTPAHRGGVAAAARSVPAAASAPAATPCGNEPERRTPRNRSRQPLRQRRGLTCNPATRRKP